MGSCRQLKIQPCVKILAVGQLSAVEAVENSYPMSKFKNLNSCRRQLKQLKNSTVNSKYGSCRQLKQLRFLPCVKILAVRQLSAVEAVEISYPVSKFIDLSIFRQLKQLKNYTVNSKYGSCRQLKQLRFLTCGKNFLSSAVVSS